MRDGSDVIRRIKVGTPRRIRIIERGSSDLIVLGRGKRCDFKVRGSHVSRVHALVEERQDGFYLADSSINGTYVLREGDRVYKIAPGADYKLEGVGLISLGKSVDLSSPGLIRYRCE